MSEDFFNFEKRPKKKPGADIKIYIGVIALIFLLVLGFVVLNQYNPKETLSSTSEKLLQDIERVFFSGDKEIEEEKEVAEGTEEDEVIYEEDIERAEVTERESYTMTAQKGEGLTHLARRALTSYMEEEDIELSPEERIYMEDYIQKNLQVERGGDSLEVEEEVEISIELLEEALEEVEQLTPSEIQNLTQYTAFVSF